MPDFFTKITSEVEKEIIKPTLTKEQEVELVEKCLQLKAAKVRAFNLQGIKWIYEKYFPSEFHAHNSKKDWDTCHIKTQKVTRLIKAFNKRFEIQPQTYQEAQYCKELAEFYNEEIFVPVISEQIKDEIINKSIHFSESSKTPHLDAIKWFYQTYYEDYYQKYEKFNKWDSTGLSGKKVQTWVSRKKYQTAKQKRPLSPKRPKFPEEDIHLGNALILDIFSI